MLPLTPVSISSNILVCIGKLSPKIVFNANINLDNSPPLAVFDNGFKGSPLLKET